MAAERTFRNLMDGDARGRHSPGGVSSPGASAASPLSATASPARPNGITPISTYAAKLSQWGLDARDANAPAEASEAPLSPLQDFAIARFLHATPAEQSQMAISPDDDLSPVEGADPAHLYRALMRACSNGDAVRIRHVLDTKAEEGTKLDLDQPDADGVTPLILAACYGHTEAVHELLLHGANPDVGDADGWTPLIWAANNRQPAVARVLLSYNASVNPQTSRGRTVRDFIGEDPQLRALIEGAAADEPEPEPDKGHIGDGTFEDGLTTEKIEFSDDEGTVVSALTAMSVGGTAAFDYQKCLPDQMFVFSPSALPHILDVLVGKIKPAKVKRGLAGEKAEESVPVPANVIFLCARYAFYYHGGDLLETLLDATGQHICIALNDYRDDLNHLAHWLSQITQLLYYLKRDAGLSVATAAFQARFAELCGDIYLMIVRNAQRRLALIMEECILQHEPVALPRPTFDGRRGGLARRMRLPARVPTKGMFSTLAVSGGRQFPTANPTIITNILNSILFVLRLQRVHRTMIHQVFRQVFAFINAWCFNLIVDTPEYCCRSRAVQIALNFSHLEEWLRNNAGALPERKLGLLSLLQPSLKLLQLLQVLSTCQDLPSFLEVQATFLDPSSGIQSTSPAAPPKARGTLTMPQIRRVLAQYRYEAGEDTVADEVEQYVELCCVRMGDRQRTGKSLPPVASGHRSPSSSEDEGPTPISGGYHIFEDEDPMRDRFDPEILLPFKMVALSRMDGGWSGSVGRSVARVPVVPDDVLAMLDRDEIPPPVPDRN